MNGRKRGHRGNVSFVGAHSKRLILAFFFGIGLVLGCFFASRIEGGESSQLAEYLNGYFAVLEQGDMVSPGLFTTAWEVFRWPLAAWLVGFTSFGAVAVPLLFCIRGFLLSYAVSVIVRLFGWSGLALSGAVFGIAAIFSVTGLFLLGEDLFVQKQGGGRKQMPKNRAFALIFVLLFLLVGSLLHHWISPILLHAAAAWLIQ